MHKDDVYTFDLMQDFFSDTIAIGFKKLLDEKHLYQSVNIEFPKLEEILEKIIPEEKTVIQFEIIYTTASRIYDDCFNLQWKIYLPFAHRFQVDSDRYETSISLTPPTIEVFCSNCDKVEPYNYETGGDVLVGLITETTNQVFIMVYRCQACKSVPEVFLVLRKEMKITLSGRSPIEIYHVPTYIPKAQRIYYQNAEISFNTGFILAGIFYLRTLLEQYVRSQHKKPEDLDIEVIFDYYSNNLPDDFKSRFPSLYPIYGDLSDAIHMADKSEKTYKKAIGEIKLHFDAKRVFKIS